MLALTYLYHMLNTFRPLFARHTPWVLFCIVVLGFIGTPHLEGLSSLGQFWFMDEADYRRLLHSFHSSAWCLDDLVAHWSHLVMTPQVAIRVQGRAVLGGDHPAVVKDARRMPGVVTLYQDIDCLLSLKEEDSQDSRTWVSPQRGLWVSTDASTPIGFRPWAALQPGPMLEGCL